MTPDDLPRTPTELFEGYLAARCHYERARRWLDDDQRQTWRREVVKYERAIALAHAKATGGAVVG